MKLVMENKSGYIRPLCALHIQYPHRQQPWDVSWPIENQLYLPNKEAVVKNYDEWKTESCKIEKSSGYWSVKKKKKKKKQAAITVSTPAVYLSDTQMSKHADRSSLETIQGGFSVPGM